MDMTNATTITVSNDSWKRLNQRKEPGESFEDVVQRLLDEAGGTDQ